jgi:arylsulfatase A-like enzyme
MHGKCPKQSNVKPALCVLGILLTLAAAIMAAERPNIVYVLCDDLGYGDLACLNPEGKIPTPHFDRVAREGMAFTDAHSGSSVCTPTRYGILTGRYAWRSRLQQGVLGGLSPRLIEPGRLTVAALLKQHGYHTAVIGKWHLGLDWVRLPGKDVSELAIESPQQVWNVDYAQPFAGGPTALGFDEFFGISASLDMVPYTFLEQDRVTVLPTVEKAFPMMLGRSGGMTRLGPAAPAFEAVDVLPMLTRRAVEYLARRAADARSGRPFFLYLPLASPHTPIVPAPPWQGKSGLNPYADFVMQTDAALGEVLQALDRYGLADQTLVIVTSDNGCSPQARYEELLPQGHNPSYRFRGHKADIYEGGHRVPLLVRWPGKVPPNSRSDQLTCLTDFLATCAEMLGVNLPPDAGEDSVSLWPALTGRADRPLREAVVHHSIQGAFAIRQGPWKLCFCPGSGGWSAPRPGRDDTRGLPSQQLFHLESDPGEQRNVVAEHPQIVAQLTALMDRYVREGRSTVGPPQKNAVDVDFLRGEQVPPPTRAKAGRLQTPAGQAKGKGKAAKASP